MKLGFDTMLVCESGHQITALLKTRPHRNVAFCTRCGAPTLNQCPKCGIDIKGCEHIPGGRLSRVPVPRYCHGCGSPYPWQAAVLENIQGLAAEGGLSNEDQAELATALNDVARDTPNTESASLKVKCLLGKLGKPAGDLALKVISDVASETAKKILFRH